MAGLICALALVALSATRAEADHHGMSMSASTDADPDTSTITAGVSVIAAQFGTMYYAGDYQAVMPSLGWSRGRFSASAALGLYRLDENGLEVQGIGDATGRVNAKLLARGSVQAGVSLAASLPTADGEQGLGMGHTMLMPSAWTTWQTGHVTVAASAGYSRALVALEDHVHGTWPLVDPMNMSEISWSGGAEVDLGTAGLRAGARLSGGVPVGAPGIERVIGGARLSWGRGRIVTAVALEAGLVGDPFTLRGVAETALRF